MEVESLYSPGFSGTSDFPAFPKCWDSNGKKSRCVGRIPTWHHHVMPLGLIIPHMYFFIKQMTSSAPPGKISLHTCPSSNLLHLDKQHHHSPKCSTEKSRRSLGLLSLVFNYIMLTLPSKIDYSFYFFSTATGIPHLLLLKTAARASELVLYLPPLSTIH